MRTPPVSLLKADGTLDPADSYQRPWLGPHAVATTETALWGGGRPVIGLTCYQARHLSGFGLVVCVRHPVHAARCLTTALMHEGTHDHH